MPHCLVPSRFQGRPPNTWPVVWFAFLTLVLVMAACGGNPNEAVEADEFIRAVVPSSTAPVPDPTPSDLAEPGGGGDDAAPDSGPPDSISPVTPGVADDPNGFDDIDLADDIVRRYLNDSYRFSLELVCGAFCNIGTTGVDRIVFVADNGLSFIDISVVNPVLLGLEPGLPALETEWELRRSGNPSFNVTGREDTVLPSDGQTPGRLIQWEIDQRAGGGVLLLLRSLLVQVGPLAYFIETGADADELEFVEADLQASVDSFIATPNPPSLPGTYARFGFVFPYDHTSVTTELGTPLPTFDMGLFEQRAVDGLLELLIRWETINEDFFDPDESIAMLEEGLIASAVESSEIERADLQLPGASGRLALFDVVFQGGIAGQVGFYAWYCQDSGRSFVLQSLSRDNVRAMVQPSLDGFRCLGEEESPP